MRKDRLEEFSDRVIAIIIAIMGLEREIRPRQRHRGGPRRGAEASQIVGTCS